MIYRDIQEKLISIGRIIFQSHINNPRPNSWGFMRD